MVSAELPVAKEYRLESSDSSKSASEADSDVSLSTSGLESATIVLGLAAAREDTDQMRGVERDTGERAYEPSADCERGGTIARALVLRPILVVPSRNLAWTRYDRGSR